MVAVKTKVILEWKRCDRKEHWGTDNVLLSLDLNGDYVNTPFIVVCFAGMFYGLFFFFFINMLFNAAVSLSFFIEHLNMPSYLNS